MSATTPERWAGEARHQPLVVQHPKGIRARLVIEPPPAPTEGTVWIVCPWLRGLDGPYDFWLSALPIHDANAYLVDPRSPAPASWVGRTDLYWSVFALDLFRSRETLWQAARRNGISAIINLPSLTFFTGETRSTFAALGYSAVSEAAFLLEARRQGFRAGWFGDPETIRDMAEHDFALFVTADPPDAMARS